ncbi:hypothetical protein F5Y18DRAFT_297470 [Xylariaceae sp. FL1019]|nr:hypothetical protein F5Y18DRAFT_297470 [Xylariaceae sp. FL1019]
MGRMGSLWSALPIGKPAEENRQRRKLQKAGNQQRPYSASYSEATASSVTSPAASAVHVNKSKSRLSLPSRERSLPPFPELDDATWLEDFRRSGYADREINSAPRRLQQTPRVRPSSVVMPEFAHLAVSDPAPKPPIQPITRNVPPYLQPTRRYAKTPVSSIGQLENKSESSNGEESQIDPNIENIAESYRALLESRCSFMSESTVDRDVDPEQDEMYYIKDPRMLAPDFLEPVVEVPEPPPMTGSPKSDEVTLIAFEDEPVYLKPNLSSRSSYETASPGSEQDPETPSDSPSLQICLDLLTRELSSAVSGSTTRPSAETSSLQLWVMIEAYEKLRDQVVNAQSNEADKSAMIATFDMWLNSLHAVHNKMSGDDDGQRSESNYGD